MSEDKVLVSYIPKLDYDLIKNIGLDFVKLANKYKDSEYKEVDNTSIAISAAITAYAIIHISKIKLHILSKGGEIYYSDTDSIVTNLKLDSNMVDPKLLGKLKLEHKVKEAIFIAGKTYCLIDDKDNFINKAKGVKSTSLNYDDYVKLLNNENINTAVKPMSKIDWINGQVSIFDKENVTLNSNAYTKRTKIYNSDNKWIDTKPNVINNIIPNNSTLNSVIKKSKRSFHSMRILYYNNNINYFDRNLLIYKYYCI